MVGYSQVAKAYRLFDEENQKIVERRDVLFEEDAVGKYTSEQLSKDPDDYVFFDTVTCKQNIGDKPVIIKDTTCQNSDDEITNSDDSDGFTGFETAEENEPKNNKVESSNEKENMAKRSGRPRSIKTGKRGRPRKHQTLNNMIEDNVPTTVEDALNSCNKNEWYEAMRSEMKSLNDNGTWSLVDLPSGAKAINSKWVYAIKKNEYGDIERYKARLVAKGCSQRFGVDYNEIFSPVVRYSTIRLILALAVQWKMYLHQIDVSSAYLNSEIHHEIYMKQPEKFIDHRYPDKVLKLHRAIYGLKQSGKEWNDKLDSVLKRIGFEQTKNEPCLYKASFNDQLVIVAVYVDDLLIGSKDEAQISKVKELLANNFPVTDKGKLHHYLGIEIVRDGDTGTITMSHTQYIKEMLEKYRMENCKPMTTPLEVNYQVNCFADNCEVVDQHEYQSIIGALMYLAITTRPDILHSVSKLAQRNTNPHIEHMQAAKRILRYLRGTIDRKITYQVSDKSMNGYVDADWGGNALDRKSFTGFIFFIGQCPISWESRKQSCVALSSTEAEYMAMSDAAKEAIFLRRLLMEIGYTSGESFVLNIDNQGAERLAVNPVHHKRTKHIDIRFHHVREVVKNKEISLNYCPSENMIADILTKNLSKTKHFHFMKLMRLL